MRNKALTNLLLIVLFLQVSILSAAQGINQLWSMSKSGGDENLGTIFSLDGNGNNFQVRNSFKTLAAGDDPRAELVLFNNKFYGMTDWGGASDGGVIFEWNPASNAYTKKIDLTFANGYHPTGSMTLYNGKFYGMTAKGGASDAGVIFEWDPASNIYTKKVTLTPANGGYPAGELIELNGKFYGMTYSGGTNNHGTIFEWDLATNVYTKKINLIMADGAYPEGNLALHNNKFYGMTYFGGASSGGVIFEWDPASNVYTKKVELVTATGSGPHGSLTLKDGIFYGMTANGGANSYGVIFEWNPASNIYTKKIDLSTAVGGNPMGSLTLLSGKLYGMTRAGGTNFSGTVFEWDPASNIHTRKIDLNTANGKFPYGNLTIANGKLYGMTSEGGGMNMGVILEYDPVTNAFSKKIDFGATSGKNPYGSVAFKDGKVYGTTRTGGANLGNGVIFEFDPATNTNTTKVNFLSATGGAPEGELTFVNGKFYGTTYSGGANFTGTIYEWDPSNNNYSKRYDFVNATGWAPSGMLTYYNGKFYGTTFKGGANNWGVIFEWDPVSGTYTKRYDFVSADGLAGAGMTLYNGKFYGMTVYDPTTGNSHYGTIYEWDPSTNQYTKKIDLTSYQGGGFQFSRNLIFLNQKCYGVSSGGANNLGFIFEWDPTTNAFSKRFDFSSSTGSFGTTALTYSQGKFYGINSYGGANNYGVIFEWDPVTNTYNKKVDFNGNNGRNPSTGNALVSQPAPVADVPKGNCISLSSVTINESNSNQWVAITNGNGHAIAEINANGNNLGVVSTTVYINDQEVREDNGKNLYLDRNLTITPENQPTSPVAIRLYIKGEELESLKIALNSNGKGAGITGIGDLGIFKASHGCQEGISTTAMPITTTGLSWGENGYVLVGSITSFSSFYFAKNTNNSLPVSLISFTGNLDEEGVRLQWGTSAESNSANYEIQRSHDAASFLTLAAVSSAINAVSQQDYRFIDRDPLSGINYYRLRMNDQDGTYTFSKAIAIHVPRPESSENHLAPNPTKQLLSVTVGSDENVIYKIINVSGQVIKEQSIGKTKSSQTLTIDVSTLPIGLYFFAIRGEKTNDLLKFIKE